MDLHELTPTPVATTSSLHGTPDLLPSTEQRPLEGVRERSSVTPTPTAPPARARGAARFAIGAATAGAIVLVAGIAVAMLSGMRWFVVETPSMGTAAPVGALVITRPALAPLQRGDVIAFTPPGPPRVYTHRVLSVARSGAVRTKGDINAVPDPWTVPRTAVLGTAIAVLPGGGYLVRALPGLLIGGVLLWAGTLLIRRRDQRAAARVLGLHVVAAVVVLRLHPFVQVVLLATASASGGVKASMVSTGLLPVRLVDSAGTVLARLSPGRPEVVAMPTASHLAGHVLALPDLGPALQAAFVGAALLPALLVLVLGLPARNEMAP